MRVPKQLLAEPPPASLTSDAEKSDIHSAFATARIGTTRFVLEDVKAQLCGGTVVATLYLRGLDLPVIVRLARGKARAFANALGMVLAE